MKFCPTCQTRYDEEILLFCTKDGTPLIEESQPNFTALPSESLDDERDEETIVRRKSPVSSSPADYEPNRASTPRIVIPTGEQQPREQQQPQIKPAPYQAAPKNNTAKVVLLTILGTVVVLAGAAGVFWMLQSEKNEPRNSNTNFNTVNTNPPTNLYIGNSLDLNTNINPNLNINANINVKTPTPTATPRPSPTATPTPTPRPTPDDEANTSANINSALPGNTRPTPSPTPITPVEPPVNRPVNVGLLNSRALNLPTPAYPSQARSLRIGGRVTVQVQIDETGNVAVARAVAGHPLLRQAAEAAARQSRFNPIRVNNQAVAANGVLIYNFIN